MKRCGFAARARGTFTTEYKFEPAQRLVDSGRTIAEVARELSLLQHSKAPLRDRNAQPHRPRTITGPGQPGRITSIHFSGGTLSATSEETTAMRNYVVVALAAELMMTGALIATAPPASAGCVPYDQKLLCDGPIQPDGSWQRCLPLQRGQLYCWLLGPGHAQPWYIFTAPLPLNHIDP
jgi:hypothetical protein